MHPRFTCHVPARSVSRKTILENVAPGLTRVVLAIALAAAAGCGRRTPQPPVAAAPKLISVERPRRAEPPRSPPAGVPEADALPAAADLAPERRAIEVAGGAERTVDVEAARARGLTVVDLSDAWVPSVLDDHPGPRGTTLVNPYHAIYTGLAADRTDGDGQQLGAGERNYLELYGIPPSLSVLRRRFLEDARRDCGAAFDPEKLLAIDEVRTWGASTEAKELGKQTARGARLEAARVAAGAATLEALAAADPRTAKDVRENARFVAERAAFGEIEKRLVCEGLLEPARHKIGAYDTAMRTAMLSFQQKHAVMDQADIKRSTLEALARLPLENDMLSLRRVLTERAMHAAGFLEDGSVSDDDRPGGALGGPELSRRGRRAPRRSGFWRRPSLAAVLQALGIATPEDAVAFFRRHSRADFGWLKVAARLPAPPPYYGPAMELSAEIDRGDVWYDFPFDAKGQRLPQPRERFPTFTLFVKWRGEKVPLVRWRTTVGGWRVELASDGQEYYRYKGSDVGPRVWHHIVAAPVWIPPSSSPLASFVKEKRVNGIYAKVTNYDETGPGYLSAYGLAAAIHEEMRRGPEGPTFFDNGIRTHGSFDYMSLRGRFSHGCHRLYNQQAMRLFSFVLGHRKMRVVGSIPLGFRRLFYAQGELFEMRLPSRGFYYEIDPPCRSTSSRGPSRGRCKSRSPATSPSRGSNTPPRSCRRRRPRRQPRRGRRAVSRRPVFLAATAFALALSTGCGSPGPAPGAPAPAAHRPPRRPLRASDLALPDEAPEPMAPTAPGGPEVTIKLLADANRKAHVFWGRKDLGLAPLEIRRPRGSGPLDLLVIAPGFLPLHTRAFTDRDDTLSLRLYDEEAARGLLGHPIATDSRRPSTSRVDLESIVEPASRESHGA